MLGQRLPVQIDGNGVDFDLTNDPSSMNDGILHAYTQLEGLSRRLRDVVCDGLPLSVAHSVWVYASSGAIRHVFCTQFYDDAALADLVALQLDHIKWITDREIGENS